jgi:hypothetical protein
MASSSTTSNPLFGIQIAEKLNKNNHALWQAEGLAVICGARMEEHISGRLELQMLRSMKRDLMARPSKSLTQCMKNGSPKTSRSSGLSSPLF